MIEETTTNTSEIQRIVRNYYKELYAKKCENRNKMDKFLEKYNLPKLNEEEAESLQGWNDDVLCPQVSASTNKN